ncbi:bifunctional precorrin-2 dehydrogenase/sirohydrochlorin ferrochelatase, partial [Streptomyces galilaeus]|uniref:precorrin-2 dehydrogenase/sirohydrochlorin ferrochelatase family protein n=1 Tax=Streptomyces galilaeus TaxID=33899 RepID=UPI0038F77674
LLVNVVDRPALCDFTTPSLVDRAPVVIAVGTDGASAGLAKAVRLGIDRLLPQSVGALAMGLQAARGALRERWPGAADRRRALDT